MFTPWEQNGTLLVDADGVVIECDHCPCTSGSGEGGSGEGGSSAGGGGTGRTGRHWAGCANQFLPGTLYLFIGYDSLDCPPICPGIDHNAGAPPLQLTYSSSLATWISPLVPIRGPDLANPCNNAALATFELTSCIGSLSSTEWPPACQCGILARCYNADGTPAGTSTECLGHNCLVDRGRFDSCFADPSAACYEPQFADALFVMRDHAGGMCALCRYSLILQTTPNVIP